MTTAKDTTLKLFINGKQIKKVDTFVYLGHNLSVKNDGAVAVKHRIGLGWDGQSSRRTSQCLHLEGSPTKLNLRSTTPMS